MADEKGRPAPELTTAAPEDNAALSDGSGGFVLRDAKAAAEKERKMTLWQGVKLYPKAIAWSVLISTCIVMEGYDISLVNNFCESYERDAYHIPLPLQFVSLRLIQDL